MIFILFLFNVVILFLMVMDMFVIFSNFMLVLLIVILGIWRVKNIKWGRFFRIKIFEYNNMD